MTKLEVFTACPAKVGQHAFGHPIETVANEHQQCIHIYHPEKSGVNLAHHTI
jgi:hypothetical protein